VELSACDIVEKIYSGESSVEEVATIFYENLWKVEDKIKSFITVRTLDEILKDAKIVSEKIRGTNRRLLLAGVPIAVKDNISTRGIRTTCASKILENYIPPYDATVVTKLKMEGAIIVGKTNMDEFAMGSTTENSAFGPTRNPWDPSRVPGGSSGGSATAVASYQTPISLGSDTGGSIRCPASFTGTYGLKPTYGLVSRYGLVAYANSLEQIGPIARNTLDLALLLTVIAGYDPKDGTTIPIPGRNYFEELKNWEPNIEGLKVGIVREMIGEGVEEPVLKIFKHAVNTLESLGAIIDDVSIPCLKYALPTYYVIAMSEASSNLARYDGVRYGFRANITGDWNTVYMKTRGLGFGKEVKRRIILGTFTLSAGYFEQYYLKALKIRRLIKEGFDRAFEKFDVLISPTMPVLPFKIGERIKDPLSMYMVDMETVPVNLAGIPAISIPAGIYNGLPVGLQIMGKPLSEMLLLKVARAFELKTRLYNLTPPISTLR